MTLFYTSGKSPCTMSVLYTRGCAVHQEDTISTVGDIVSTVGEFSTPGDIMSTLGDIMINLGKSLGKQLNLYGNPSVLNIPQCTHDIPPHS